jgi:hypothetical protein
MIHGADALFENPAPPTFLVERSDRHWVNMIDGKRFGMIVVIDASDLYEESHGTVFIDQFE